MLIFAVLGDQQAVESWRLNQYENADGTLSKMKVMNNDQAKQKKKTQIFSVLNSLINIEHQTIKRDRRCIAGDTGMGHLKNFLSHELILYIPSIFGRSAIS